MNSLKLGKSFRQTTAIGLKNDQKSWAISVKIAEKVCIVLYTSPKIALLNKKMTKKYFKFKHLTESSGVKINQLCKEHGAPKQF